MRRSCSHDVRLDTSSRFFILGLGYDGCSVGDAVVGKSGEYGGQLETVYYDI